MSDPAPIVSPDDGADNDDDAVAVDEPRADGLPRDPDATEHLDVDITGDGPV
ncbi:MAG: hypothetical protein M3Y46_04070 [Actinomycetota bacterium]|nr:hypothetical protein [Actinomycetota bacterium]